MHGELPITRTRRVVRGLIMACVNQHVYLLFSFYVLLVLVCVFAETCALRGRACWVRARALRTQYVGLGFREKRRNK